MTNTTCRRAEVGHALSAFVTLGAWLSLLASASLCAPQDSANSFVDQFNKAREAEKHGEYREAITLYQHILTLNPVATEAYSNLGLDYYRLNRYAEAAAALKHALKIQPSLVGDQIVLGLAEFKLGQFKDSRSQLESALKAQPNNREIRFFLIQDQMALGQFDTAFVNQTIGLYPSDAELNYTIGLAALERMREVAHQAQSLGPQSPIYQWIYLRQAQERQDSADAQKHQKALEKLGVTDPPAPVRDYDDLTSLVNQCFTAVLQSSPDSSYAHSVQGAIDEAQNLIDEGLAEYRIAGNHFAAGRLLAQNLRLPEAAEELEAALRTDPENHLALALLAQVYVQEHDSERALPLLHVILHYYPEDALAWSDLGKAEMSLNKTAEGIDSLRRALKIDPSQTHLHYELAMAYRKLGDSDNAERELAEFRKASEAEHDK